MDTKKYTEGDRQLIEVDGGCLTGNSYAKLAFSISLASALVVLVLGLIGVVVNMFGYQVDSTMNLTMLGLMVIAHVISIYILLLLSYPFYKFIANKLTKPKFVFSERR